MSRGTRRVKGQVISSEMLVITAIVSVLIVLVFLTVSKPLSAKIMVNNAIVEGKACGSVLIVKAVRHDAKITQITCITDGDSYTILNSGLLLKEGDVRIFNAGRYCKFFAISGENFRLVVVKNDC